jgi:hypothetical protein
MTITIPSYEVDKWLRKIIPDQVIAGYLIISVGMEYDRSLKIELVEKEVQDGPFPEVRG